METKLHGIETLGKIDTKHDGLGLISLVWYFTHRLEETEQAMIDIVRAYKDLIFSHKK